MKNRRFLCAAVTALFIFTGSSGIAANQGADASPDWLEEKGLTLGESSIAYPALREGTVPETLRVKAQVTPTDSIHRRLSRRLSLPLNRRRHRSQSRRRPCRNRRH